MGALGTMAFAFNTVILPEIQVLLHQLIIMCSNVSISFIHSERTLDRLSRPS